MSARALSQATGLMAALLAVQASGLWETEDSYTALYRTLRRALVQCRQVQRLVLEHRDFEDQIEPIDLALANLISPLFESYTSPHEKKWLDKWTNPVGEGEEAARQTPQKHMKYMRQELNVVDYVLRGESEEPALVRDPAECTERLTTVWHRLQGFIDDNKRRLFDVGDIRGAEKSMHFEVAGMFNILTFLCYRELYARHGEDVRQEIAGLASSLPGLEGLTMFGFPMWHEGTLDELFEILPQYPNLTVRDVI